MTLSWSKARALVAGLLIVLVTNTVALGGVAWNRSGEPRGALTLTERELPVSRRDWLDHENSGIDLELKWRVRPADTEWDRSYHAQTRELHWLDEARKEQLGFVAPAAASKTRTWDPPKREAFVVLENDGPAHRVAVEQARAHLERETRLGKANPGVEEFERRLRWARQRLEREESFASRLFVVDVGPDADTLRSRYSDRLRYAVVRAHLDARLEGEPPAVRSVVYVVDLEIPTIAVPHAFRAIVASLLRRDPSDDHAPRFETTVHWGRRLEPWITGLRRVGLRVS